MTFPKEPLTLNCCFTPDDTVRFYFYAPDRLDIAIKRDEKRQDVLLTAADTWNLVGYLLAALLEAKSLQCK